jgi:hypothetical protein
MKKTIIAIAATMFLISCGGSSENSTLVDSTVVVDSTAVADSSVSATQGGGAPVEEVFQAKDGELGNPTKREENK